MERMLAYQCDATTLTGFLADGSRGRDVPGVLVCHEANGLGERAKQAARQLANLGLVAFAMDLYGEAFPIEDTPIHHARLMSTPGLMARRASAALARLTEEEHVDPERLAAIGFCQGGVVTLELARQQAPIRAAIGFHPAFARPEGSRDGPISAKVLMMVGDADPLVGESDQRRFIKDMTAAGADWQLHIFGGTGHSFTSPAIDALGLPGFSYDGRAERRAWAAMADCLGECFGLPSLMGPSA